MTTEFGLTSTVSAESVPVPDGGLAIPGEKTKEGTGSSDGLIAGESLGSKVGLKMNDGLTENEDCSIPRLS